MSRLLDDVPRLVYLATLALEGEVGEAPRDYNKNGKHCYFIDILMHIGMVNKPSGHQRQSGGMKHDKFF